MYVLKNGMKMVEEDDYEKGCLPETSFMVTMDVEFKAQTTDRIIKQVENFFAVEREDILVNACDEPGRLDVQVLENGHGYTASESEIEDWKQGLVKLYAVCYSFNLYEQNPTSF